MIFRKTTVDDIPQIIIIFNQAKAYLKEQNIDQWQNGYPDESSLLEDIQQQIAYVLCDDTNIPIATTAFCFNGEPTYNKIYEGKWLTSNSYGVIHRIAVDQNYKGKNIAKVLLEHCENLCHEQQIQSIRVDTHKDNQSMQNLLTKNNFTKCGIILLDDNSERIAFEKVLIIL